MQPVSGLLLDVGVAGQPLLLGLKPAEAGGDRLPLRLQLIDLTALGDVLPDRVGEAERDRANHHGEHRRPAGEPGPIPARWAAKRWDHGRAGVLGKAAAPA